MQTQRRERPDRLLTTAEAAEHTGMSERDFREAARALHVQPIRDAAGVERWSRYALRKIDREG